MQYFGWIYNLNVTIKKNKKIYDKHSSNQKKKIVLKKQQQTKAMEMFQIKEGVLVLWGYYYKEYHKLSIQTRNIYSLQFWC